jgi:hypothetical protein
MNDNWMWGMGNKFETPGADRDEDSPGQSFLPGTTPPRTTKRNSPESSQVIKHASTSSAEKWSEEIDVGNNYSYPFDADELNLDVAEDLMSSSCPHLFSLKTEEKPSVEDPPPVKGQPSRDSPAPDVESMGSAGSSVDKWQTRFEELKEYKAKYTSLEVPQKYGALGLWVNKQRNEYTHLKKGVKSQMTQERISQLNLIDFRWAQPKGQKLWEARFNELKEYKEKVRQ